MHTYQKKISNLWAVIITGLLIGYIILSQSGCAQIIGIKRYKSGETVIDFNTGFDFGVSANQVDTVHNERGIKPAQ